MPKRVIDDATKIAAVEAYKSGEKRNALIERLNITSGMLSNWIKTFANGAAAPRAKEGGKGKRKGKRRYTQYSEETKREAVAALDAGESGAQISKRMGLADVNRVYIWRRTLRRNGATAPKAKAGTAPQTPERVFDDRVREAISWLRRAEKEVDRMKRTGAIKEPDKAHLCAMMALRDLQGDNGT